MAWQGTGNQFLDALPSDIRERILAGAVTELLPLRRILFEPDQRIETVRFPVSGVVSLVATMQDGGNVEVATVGREGIVGVPTVLGRSLPKVTAVAQVAGRALAIPAASFVSEVERDEKVASLVHSFVHALFTLIGQNAACNRLHSITQRCARWLLMTQDRVESASFELTHEFLAQMLGARRASVTEAAGTLQDVGAISYRRGVVNVLDRDALEICSCECYRVIGESFAAMY